MVTYPRRNKCLGRHPQLFGDLERLGLEQRHCVVQQKLFVCVSCEPCMPQNKYGDFLFGSATCKPRYLRDLPHRALE